MLCSAGIVLQSRLGGFAKVWGDVAQPAGSEGAAVGWASFPGVPVPAVPLFKGC